MHIDELSRDYSVTKSVIHLFDRVELLTGKEIRIEIVDQLMSFALLKAARSHMEYHIVYVRRDKMANINHLLAHECYHLLRFWSVSASERKVMSISGVDERKRTEKWKSELGTKGSQYPDQIFQHWNRGLATFLYNAVTDARIELMMAKEYPELIQDQKASLKSMAEEVKNTLDKSVEKMIPASLFIQSGAINYAFLTLLSPIVGKTWKKHFKGRSTIILLGNKLLKQISDEDLGLLQDIEYINAWARMLEIDGVQWNEFEDVPIGYEMQY